MSEVTVSDLRDHGEAVLDRVARGGTLTLTRDGRPVAELRPLPGRPLPAATLLRRVTKSGRRARLTFSRPRPTLIHCLSMRLQRVHSAGVAASLRRANRKVNAHVYDALIAAIAMANDLLVYTCNPSDFRGIAGLQIVIVPVPSTS